MNDFELRKVYSFPVKLILTRLYSNIYLKRCNVTQFIYIWKLLYMFRVVPPPIIRSTNNCIYSIWYLSHRYCYLLLSWNSWNWFECAVGLVLMYKNEYRCTVVQNRSVHHPQHSKTSFSSSTIAAGSSNGVTNTRCCRYSCMRS